jgi:putative sterol carrier protein
MMTIYQYCTPEWLAECAARAQENPKFKKVLEKLSLRMAFRVKADPSLGIDRDIIFAAYGSKGELEKLAFISEAEAEEEAEYILSATPQQWTKLLRKKSLFAGDVLVGKIAIEKGSKPGVVRIAPYSGTFVDALTQVDLQFPDEMSPEELEQYRDYINEFRAELGV